MTCLLFSTVATVSSESDQGQDCEQYEDFVRTLINEERALEQKMKGSSKLKGLKQDCEQYQRDIEATTKKLQDLEQREKMFTERCDKGREPDAESERCQGKAGTRSQG